jgi:hypothetical protein
VQDAVGKKTEDHDLEEEDLEGLFHIRKLTVPPRFGIHVLSFGAAAKM